MRLQVAFQKNVHKALYQEFHEFRRCAVTQLEGHRRVLFVDRAHGTGKKPHGLGLARAYVNDAAHLRARGTHLLLGLVRQVQDVAGIAVENGATLGEFHASVSSYKEGLAQFRLQLGNLAREGGLGHMQDICRIGDVPLVGDRPKVRKGAKLHDCLSLFIRNSYGSYFIIGI